MPGARLSMPGTDAHQCRVLSLVNAGYESRVNAECRKHVFALAAPVVPLGISLDSRQNLDNLARLVDERRRLAPQSRLGMTNQSQPVSRLPRVFARYRNLRPEVWFRLTRLRLPPDSPNRRPRSNQLPGELPQNRGRAEKRFAEIDNATREQEGTILDVVRSRHAARSLHLGCRCKYQTKRDRSVVSTHILQSPPR